MKVFGNDEGLKKEIGEKYAKEIDSVKAEAASKAKEIGWQAGKEIELIMDQAKTDAESAAREAYQRVLNEEKLRAKRGFEEAREKMIQKVLEEVRKQAPKKAASNEYLAFVKKNAPREKTEVIGNSALKKSFNGLKADNTMAGVKFVSDNIVYDLSLSGAIEAQEELVRRTITKNLFGE